MGPFLLHQILALTSFTRWAYIHTHASSSHPFRSRCAHCWLRKEARQSRNLEIHALREERRELDL